MEYLESKEAFENAVRNGLETPEDYMYMYSIGKNDYFKHMITRKYRCIERQMEKSEWKKNDRLKNWGQNITSSAFGTFS